MKKSEDVKAVKCNNGTFVGNKTGELIIWKGIPYATQPVGKLRWKKALPAVLGRTPWQWVVQEGMLNIEKLYRKTNGLLKTKEDDRYETLKWSKK